MTRLIDKDQNFQGHLVAVASMKDEDIEEMLVLARDENIWTHLPFDGMDTDNFRRELKSSLILKATGEQHPFTIRELKSGRIIGSTRFFEIFTVHKKLEIGWTWMHPNYWGKGHNLETKLLLLTYCFETLLLNRVQLKTRVSNLRSKKAILKIGGHYEGLLRKDRIMRDGTTRDTLVFSLINDDWPHTKQQLQNLIAPYLT